MPVNVATSLAKRKDNYMMGVIFATISLGCIAIFLVVVLLD